MPQIIFKKNIIIIMINIYEYLTSKLSFAASRKAQYDKKEKPFEDFKKFLENLEDISGLYVGLRLNSEIKLPEWLININNENDFIVNGNDKEKIRKNVLEFNKIYKDTLCIYTDVLYEIRKNEATKGNYKKHILNKIFIETDIYKKSQLTDDKYLIIGKFEINDPALKSLKKWGFKEGFISNKYSLPFDIYYDHRSENWYFTYNSDYLRKPSDNLDDDGNPVIYLAISFKTLCENIKYINKEFFDIAEDSLQESKISKLIK